METELCATALVNNQALQGLFCEHGLSIWISYRAQQYLLDSGATNQFLENAKQLNIDLAKVDNAVLSHAHYDHAGGFPAFFEKNHHATVYLQSAAQEPCYKEKNGLKEYIGIPLGMLERWKNRICYVSGKTPLCSGVWLLSHDTPELAQKGRQVGMFRYVENSSWIPDNFAHEQSMIFETEKGLVVMNSCCHAGADIVVNEVLQAFPGQKVYALFGGFHLMGSDGPDTLGVSEKDVYDLAQNLKTLEVKRIYTGHCTGTPGILLLQQILGSQMVNTFYAGETVKI